MLNFESQLTTISRNCKSDLLAIGSKSLMKIYKLTDTNEFKYVKTLKTAKSNNKVGTTDLAWNNHLENILASNILFNNQVRVWDINKISHTEINQILGSHSQLINRVNWSHKDPDLLASCSQDGFLNIWNRNNKPECPVISMHHKEKIRDCEYSPFFDYLILASYMNGAIKLWDTRNYKTFVKEFLEHETDVLSVDWHPELDNIFCSGSMDKNLYIWDINQSAPIMSYKTTHGTSRVKWWKKNPQYIISSYQTNNFYTSMWNINIDNMPEYMYKGHKDVVTGFCWDLSENRLITCSKDNYVIVNNFNEGFRCIDYLSMNGVKFSQDNELMLYSENKPKKVDLGKINYNKLIQLASQDKNKFPKKKYTVNMLNFNNTPPMSNAWSAPVGIQHVPLAIKKKNSINTGKHEIALTYSVKLQQYYTLTKSQIKEIFSNYGFISNLAHYNNDQFDLTGEKAYSEKIQKIVFHNWKYSKDTFKNYTHFSIWSQLKFLSESESFQCLDEFLSKKSRSSLNIDRDSLENIRLYAEIIQKNIVQIIEFLINIHSDIYLATIICYLFNLILDIEGKIKSKLLRIEMECFEILRRNKLYLISAKLMKFGLYNELKKNKENNLILVSCKKCNYAYDPTTLHGTCGNCKNKIKCMICLLPINGLYTWCSICGHGGHPDHIALWFKKNKFCPSGCGHKCE